MGDEIAKRDQNSAVVLTAITDDSNEYIRMLRVDPTTNRLLVSGNGGGGSGYQLPTGTVNGTNKTFVFATTPNAIVVDGATLQQTEQGGTINWTIVGTTVTLLVAPTQSVFAVA